MQIDSVRIPVRDRDEAAHFFRDTLQLPATGTPGGDDFAVVVGTSSLRFDDDPGAGCQHVAFQIDVGAFGAAKQWLLERVTLYTNPAGGEEFEGPAGWDSRSLYFSGPSESVLEFIARRRLHSRPRNEAFGPADILSVSEIGIAVDDVPAAARALTEQAGLHPFVFPPSDAFAAMGDDEGLVILAVSGRMWAPTDDRRASPSGIRVAARGPRRAELTMGAAQLAFAAEG